MRTFFTGTLLMLYTFGLRAQESVQTFLPGLVSTDKIEYYTTFSPDGLDLYFVRRDAKWGDFNDKTPGHIYKSHFNKGQWSQPKVAPFSGTYSDGAPFISQDGRWFFFTSNRPYEGKKGSGSDIWVMKKKGNGWTKPKPMGGDINSPGTEYSPVLTTSGNLYYASMRAGSIGQGDIFSCRFKEGNCYRSINEGRAINTKTGEWNVFVAPDERYMIFEASGRIANRDNGDLYISFRKNGAWQPAQFMEALNTKGSDLAVRLSADGKWLYFAQSHDGEVDIKQVSVDVIKAYR